MAEPLTVTVTWDGARYLVAVTGADRASCAWDLKLHLRATWAHDVMGYSVSGRKANALRTWVEAWSVRGAVLRGTECLLGAT